MDADGFTQAAWCMPIFPLIGAAIGLVVGIGVWFLESALPQLVSAMIGLGLLYMINGVQNLDGLLDFGDGLMYHGSKSAKLRVMADPTTGAGGFTLGIVVVLITAFSLASVPTSLIMLSLVVSEASAMFAMVLATGAGKSAHKGMSVVFIEAMRRKRGLRLSICTATMVVVSFLALRLTGLIVVVGSTATALVVLRISNRNFGGVTGDVLGAVHELGRLISLLLVLVFLKWV
jgi:adenosylcobinamide-GDP ribazoletransferase